MKDIKNSDKEKMLLTGKTIEELIQMKIKEEYKAIFNLPPVKFQKINDITKVPKEVIFSKDAVFKVFNKNTRCESLINGIQAEALLGMQDEEREALLAGRIKAFVTDNAYVEFFYAKTRV